MDSAAGPSASRAAGRRSGPSRAGGAGSGEFAPQLRGGLRRPVERQRPLLAATADLRLDLARLDAALADRQTQRAPEQLRVRELLPRARVAVVVQDAEPFALELAVQAVRPLARGLSRLGQGDQVDVERRYRARPRDAGVVRVLLDSGGQDAR